MRNEPLSWTWQLLAGMPAASPPGFPLELPRHPASWGLWKVGSALNTYCSILARSILRPTASSASWSSWMVKLWCG